MTNIQGDRLPAYSFRNRIINGDMRIDQRNVGATLIVSAGTGPYGADRWQIAPTGNSCAAKQISTGSGFAYVLMGNTSITNCAISTKMEANNVLDLLGKTVTLQAKVSSTTLTTLTWNAYYCNNVIDTWSTANSINFANGNWSINTTSTVYSTTFTVNNSCSNGIYIALSTGSFTSGNLTITDVQLEADSVPSPFERRPTNIELALCQRYYQKSIAQTLAPTTGAGTGSGRVTAIYQTSSISAAGACSSFPVVMRAYPTMTMYDGVGTAGCYQWYNSGWQNGITGGTINGFDSGMNWQANGTSTTTNFLLDYTALAEL